ncbi:MAG: hypothetical protein AABX03_04320 [Nanoarchaeota archaeon]
MESDRSQEEFKFSYTGFKTERSRYFITKVGEFDSVRYPPEEKEGSHYAIIGYFDPKSKIEIFDINGQWIFTLPGSSESIPYDDLPKYLEQTPSVGKKAVGRLIDSKGKIVPNGTLWDLLLTSHITEIFE